MPYTLKNFDSLLGMPGFSNTLLKNHFTLYQGYVNNTNILISKLEALAREKKSDTLECAEMQRRLGWEFNGMRLHELYFENMSQSAKPIDQKSELFKKIVKIYGSYENWEADFKAVGKMRGIGWVVMIWEPVSKELFNIWVNEHDVGHFVGCTPLLVMDVFEHAFMLDYGLKRTDYITAFFSAINWQIATKRFEK